MNRRPFLGLAVLSLLALPAAGAWAQAYPSQPIKLVVPYSPGGGADVVARLAAQAAGESLGQTFVVENKPGAGTIVGADYVAHSKADGYTLMFADSSTMVTNPFLYKKLPYSPERDLAPVTLVTHYPFMLISRPGFPAKSVAEVIEYAKQNPGRVTFASGGLGGPHHLAMELFMVQTRTSMIHVPYKGAAPAIQDLLGGQVDLMFLDLAAGRSFIGGGKLQPYAAANPTRLSQFPDVPTMTEAGVPGFVANTWTGIVAPAGTPPEVIARLNDAFVKALKTPAVVEKLAGLGVEAIPGTPARFADHVKTETVRMGSLIKAKNISLD
jgi:tripartite-type tricarboxylate transporter receptor subunit TctC